MISELTQHRSTRRVHFYRVIASLALAASAFAAGVSLNFVGHAKFVQTDRVLLVPIGKTVWSYGWPLRWLEKDLAEIEIDALRKDKESDGVFRTRWGIHHAPYDWVNGKYKFSAPVLCVNAFAIIAILVGNLWAEYRSILVARLKRSPIAILLCCTALFWRLFGRSPFFADPIEFKLLRAIEFTYSLVLVAICLEIVMLSIRWLSKKFREST